MGDMQNGINEEARGQILEIKSEVDNIIGALTQQNDSLDLQDIASSILKLQRIVSGLVDE
jgi:hypothetical protein